MKHTAPLSVFVLKGTICLLVLAFLTTQVKSQDLSVNLLVDQPTCPGAEDGAIAAFPAGGQPPYSYLWDNGQDSPEITDLGGGVYSVTVSDALGSTASANVTLTEPNEIIWMINSNYETCAGASDADAVVVSIQGGTSPYDLLWSTGDTTPEVHGLSAGTYTVDITDANGCTTTGSVTIEVSPEGVWAMPIETDVTCYGGNDGTLYVGAMTGTAPYSYTYTNPTFPDTNVLVGLPAGLYGITVTDANGCTGIALGTVNQPEELLLDLSALDIDCKQGTGGSITANPSGGTPPYSYSWSTSDTSQTVSNLPVGSYFLTLTDSNDCEITDDALLRSLDTIGLAVSATDETCLNAGDASARVDSVSGGISPYFFQWSNGEQSQETDNLTSGSYSVTVSDSLGCAGFQDISIGVSDDGLQVLASADSVSCFGDADGSAFLNPLNGKAPYEFSWSHDPLASTDSLSDLPAGSYSATVTDASGCTAEVPVVVETPAQLVIDLSVTDDDCGNGFNGAITAEVTNGVGSLAYIWQNGETAPNLSNLAPGLWSVTVTDANGCSESSSAQIEGENPEAGTVSITANTICLEGTSAVLAVTADGNQSIPPGYALVYILTLQPDEVIVDLGSTPDFEVFAGGEYSIHPLVYNPSTLDLTAVIDLGSSTLQEISALLFAQGGAICGDLDLTGATAQVNAPDAGLVTALSTDICLFGAEALLQALPSGTATVPQGYVLEFILISLPDQIILQSSSNPEFSTTSGGHYAIHPVVYDPSQVTLTQLVNPGETTLDELQTLLSSQISGVCADLSMQGAQMKVNQPFAGTLSASNQTICLDGSAVLSPAPNGDAIVPDGFETIYLLSEGPDKVVTDFGTTPSFTIGTSGTFTVHSFVYDPLSFNSGQIVPGITTIAELENLLLKNGGNVCGDLNGTGTAVDVVQPQAGTLQLPFDTICFAGSDSTILNATHSASPSVPAGYEIKYLLVSGSASLIEATNDQPIFTVFTGGTYTIHTLVFNPSTLPQVFLQQGQSLTQLIETITPGGGSICADIDEVGTAAVLIDPKAGVLQADLEAVCLFPNQVASISASTLIAPSVPGGFKAVYLLGSEADRTLIELNTEPTFTVSEIGQYSIHALVYDTMTLNADTIIGSYETAEFLWSDLTAGGGDICGDMDKDGVAFSVNPCDTCTNIGDYVWIDYNENGLQDANEIGLHNIPVVLMSPGPDEVFDTPDDIMVDYRLTNYSGYYLFTCVPPGEYRICITELPDEFHFTAQNVGNDDFIDSDVDTVTGCTDPFFIVKDQGDNLSFDIGVIAECLDLDFGGVIGYSQVICAGTMPDTIRELTPASGGLGEIEYIWMFSTSPVPFNQQTWTPIPNSNTPFYKPPVLFTTTYYIRCARRADCNEFVKETNIVVITVLPYDTGDCPPLLLNVSATPLFDGSVLLNWTSANEMGQVEYRVEHAPDGQHFSPLEVVASRKNGLTSNAYSMNHENPKSGTNTYRIRVQNSGHFLMYSDTVEAVLQLTEDDPITVYPNPFSTSFRVFSSGKMTNAGTLELYSASGQLIQTREYPAQQVLSSEFTLEELPTGIYFLRLIPHASKKTSVYRLVKMQ